MFILCLIVGFVFFFDMVCSIMAAIEFEQAWKDVKITKNGRAMKDGKFISVKGKPVYNELFAA